MTKKHHFILLIAFVLGWISVSITFGQITGPISVQAGTLAIFETDQKADWSISPTSKTAGMFFADSSGTRIFFASPVAGEYEVIAATVEDGEPKLYTLAFVNGQGGPTPQPEPDPQPEPEPVTFADWIKANVPDNVTPDELSSISYQFESTAARIKQGTIRTVDQAFASVRINAQRYENWQGFLEKLSKREELQTEDVRQLGKVFEEIAESLESKSSLELGVLSVELNSDNSKLQTPISTPCETGNCPTPQKPAKPQTTSRRRW